jgi:N-acetyl sugar amidotransferase
LERHKIDWARRWADLRFLLEDYARRQREKGNPYDCIIPVSGGKDSHFQVKTVRALGFNPLLVSYNHSFNTALGLRNLANLTERTDCPLVRYSTPRGTATRIAKYMLKKVGDVTWHYHAGIMTFPIQAAVQYDVPLIVWGEEGFSELVGMHNFDDQVEFTKKKRQEHSMRGFEPEDLLADPQCPLTQYELAPFFYPSDDVIERVGVRGIYLSNYISWDARTQTELVIKEMGFESAQERDRTFNIYAKNDCMFANGLHDYLKYLKFGYGRGTDDASNEIRHGRMTRNEGIDMAMKYDHVVPSDLWAFLAAADMTAEQVFEAIEPMRDPAIWGKDWKDFGGWARLDSVGNHRGPDEPTKWKPFTPTPIRPGEVLTL